MVDGKWLQILVDDYIIDTNGTCILGFSQNEDDYWLLGDIFLTGYYTIWDNIDHTAAKIGFAPHITSLKADITSGSTPYTSNYDLFYERSIIFDIYWFLQVKWFVGSFVDPYYLFYPYELLWAGFWGT